MVTGVPWLSALWLTPAVGAALTPLLTRAAPAKWAGLAVSLATLAVSGILATRFDPAGPQYQFVESRPWIASFGAGYTIGVDGIALALVVLTTVLVPLLIIAGWNDADDRGRPVGVYISLVLTAEAMVLMSFIALDVLLFYVFFEAMLIPMYFLIGRYGGRDAAAAALKFLLYSLFGGLVMLAAVIGLYAAGSGTFDFRELVTMTGSMDPQWVNLMFLGFLFAFAVKAPLWPFHTWLPGVATQATPATAVLMMAVVDKVGTFGMLRYCLQLFPDSATLFRPTVVTLAVIGII
ncbi:MAG: NADH-quinone oxidoreductase subunit M, partial [Actinobacteria bacterium]|nr:NADH-quinone oxidoreductase subunit M [Actinomycetota bacterium]